MTLDQLQAIYQASLGVGHLEALEAVYVQGYYAGADTSVSSTVQIAGLVKAQTAPSPTTLVKLTKPDQR